MHPLSESCLTQGGCDCSSRRLRTATHLKVLSPLLEQLSWLPSAYRLTKSENFQCEILLLSEYKGFPCLCSSG